VLIERVVKRVCVGSLEHTTSLFPPLHTHVYTHTHAHMHITYLLLIADTEESSDDCGDTGSGNDADDVDSKLT